jgi:hypothetical protein
MVLVAVRGAVVVPLARCTVRGCPFGWPADTSRTVCPDHDEDDPLRRAREDLGLGDVDLGALAQSVPGDHSQGQRADDAAAEDGRQ